jgi:hypothetical protein
MATSGGRTIPPITPQTIVPYPHDKLDLHHAIWACLANARVAAERRDGQRDGQAAKRDQQLAA